MSTTTASRLPSRLPKSQQKTLATSSKLQKASVKTKVKPISTGINKSPNTLSSITQLPSSQSTTTINDDDAATTKSRPFIKTNIDVTNKTSPVRSMQPSPKPSISSSITNDLKSSTKKNTVQQTTKQSSLPKRKNEVTHGRNARAAPSQDQTPKSITKNTPRKKVTLTQQSRIFAKKSVDSSTSRKTELRTEKLLAEIEELRTENRKLQAENKVLTQEKGLLTVDVCQMEHRLACEESRVFELEVEVTDLRKQSSLLNGKHDQLDRNRDYRTELDMANDLIMEQANLIMEQSARMSDQEFLIQELLAQLDEQERVCQDLQNVIDNFKTKLNIPDDFKDINFTWDLNYISI